MMHHSTQFYRIQSSDWMKETMHIHLNILCNVGKGWFSLGDDRVRNRPFWSYCNFLFGQNRIDFVEAAKAAALAASSSFCPTT